MRIAILAIAAAMASQWAYSAEAPKQLFGETAEQKKERLSWWTEARFGMFIHFGLYSLPARHEWIKSLEKTDDSQYDRYFEEFDPDRLDVRDWMARAKRAGMKYVVLTTKHHEGFCLFDSALTDYKITKTKYGRDLVREYVNACRAEGLKVGFYYSLPDWHHPQFPVDRYHPLRPVDCGPWDQRGMEGPEEPWTAINRNRDMAKYREYIYGQVRELLTNYGKIDLLWFDFTMEGPRTKHPEDWQAERLIKMVRELQPQIIVNDRLGLGKTTLDGWDFITPEQRMPDLAEVTRFGKVMPWELCQTFSGSWGYHRDENTWKTPKECIELLIRAVSRGGNLIMNVGPTGRGNFDCRACSRLDAYAQWMADHGRAIYGAGPAPAGFKAPDGTLLTYRPDLGRLYLHFIDFYPRQAPLALDFIDRVEYAQFLNDASEIVIRNRLLHMPATAPNVLVPVAELKIDLGLR